MKKLKVGIIREGKHPVDSRTPLVPAQASALIQKYPDIDLVVQASDARCFTNEEFTNAGIQVVEDVSDCDILLGVKEAPIADLLPGKTYFFFSHTIKKQPHNKKLLREILSKNICLVDYECLVNEQNVRVIAFGWWAGIVGTYNAFWTFGKKYNLFEIKRAHQCHDLSELLSELKKVTLPPVKIIITGNGRVARGGLEILEGLKIKRVEPAPFFYQSFDQPVFTQMDVNTYYRHKKGHPFHFDHFFKHPEQYESDFLPFTHHADILINAVYWDPKAPRLFSLEDMAAGDFKIKVIADITCDMNGSIPSTIRATTINDPIFDFDPVSGELPPFSSENSISVMSIDNLPNELPRDASVEFGSQLAENVLPALLGENENKMIEKATIARDGSLTKRFSYLDNWVRS